MSSSGWGVGLAASRRSRAASRWLIAPEHHCTASDSVKDSLAIMAWSAAAASCSVAAIVASRSPSAVNTSMASFSERRSRPPVHDDASRALGDAASLAACLIACLPMTAPLSNRAVGGAWQDQGRLPRVQHTAVFVKHPLIFIGDSVYPLSAFKAAQFEQISDEIYRSVIDLDTDQLITLYEGDSEQDARGAIADFINHLVGKPATKKKRVIVSGSL